MRHAVLAALLALTLSSESVLAAEIETAPDDFLPDDSTLPDGYELKAELTTSDGHGQVIEQVYVNDATDTTVRVVAMAAYSEAGAKLACRSAGERLLEDDFDVQPATVDGLPGIMAERRLGLSYTRASYVASGSACLGVVTLGQADSAPEGEEGAILRAMVGKVRAA